jgi:phosphate transport system permease protein
MAEIIMGTGKIKPVRELDKAVGKIEQKFHVPKQERGIFYRLLVASAALMVLLLVGIFITLVDKSMLSIKTFGLGFAFGTTWDPLNGIFAGFPYVIGTVVTSIIALAISFPFSMSLAVLLGEYYRSGFVSELLKNVVELLAGIPSVIYGFTALFFLVPVVRDIELALGAPPFGVSIAAASVVLAVMIIPYSASVSREIVQLVPSSLKEAAYAMGATRYEVLRKVILPYGRSGIAAGFLLSFGRAVGETMAVTMVIGNTHDLMKSIWDPSNTMASVIANEFTEATTEIYLSSLIEIGLLLFLITIVFNLIGQFIIRRLGNE